MNAFVNFQLMGYIQRSAAQLFLGKGFLRALEDGIWKFLSEERLCG